LRTAAALAESGVVFSSLTQALTFHPRLVERYLGSLVSAEEGGYASLNAASWSGGIFVYVPPGVRLEAPLQADLQGGSAGTFSRTLIIAGEGSRLEYLEGCTAPRASGAPLHAGVVELVALADSQVKFMTLQDWPDDVVNVPTKRAVVHSGASVTWVDGNLGSRSTVQRPVLRLSGRGASGRIISCGAAGPGQTLALGGTLVFEAEGCSGEISCRGVAWGGGRLETVVAEQGFPGGKRSLQRSALLLDEGSEAGGEGGQSTVLRPSPEQMFFLANMGLNDSQAKALLASGFCEPFARELPLEFSVEFTRLLQLRLEAKS
jgi:Fe-S cluster assembly protein SufB